MRAFILFCCCILSGFASDQWQRLDEAARLLDSDAQAARSAFEDLIEDHPDFAAARYNLGCLLLTDDPAAAAEQLERAVDAPVPQLAARAWHNLARARFATGRIEEALKAAAKALELEPDNEGYLHTRDELRRAWLMHQDELRRQREEAAKRLRLLDKRLPDAYQGETYEYQLRAAGGSGEGYRFQIDEEAGLPEGLSVDGDGKISGSPSAANEQAAKATVIVSDSAQESARGEVALRIWPPPLIEPEILPEVITGLPYEAQLRARGLPSMSWSIEGLPDGLSWQAQGPVVQISGSSTALGTYPVTVEARQKREGTSDRVASKQFDLVVSDSFAPDTSDMPPATAWAPYRHQLTVRGPSLDYRFSGGNQQLQIDEHGAVAGTPDEAGDMDLPLTITASDKRSRSFQLRLPVNPPPVILEQETIKLIQGRAIERALQAKDGTPPYSWELSEGMLPDGLRLDPDGVLRGAAAETGEAEVTVVLRDRWQASTQCDLTISIDPPDEQDKQEQQDQQQQQDQEQQQNQDQQDHQDQQDQQQNQDQQEQQGKQNQQQQDEQNQQEQQSADQAKQDESQDEEEQSRQLERAATRHWLDQLPEEDRQAMHRMLLQQAGKGRQNEEPW